MEFSDISGSYGLTAIGTPTSVNVTGSVQVGTPNQSIIYETTPDIVYSLALQIAVGDTLTLDMITGVVTGTVAGANQKETATIIAGAGCTSDGDLALVIEAVGLAGSPLTVNVPLTTATHTTQDLIAAQCRTTLAATSAITDFCTVGGSTNTFTLEKLDKDANDATFNALIPTARGVTGDATSDNTTAGVATSMAYKRTGTVWDATDAEGVPLAAATKVYSTLVKTTVADGGNLVIIDTEDYKKCEWLQGPHVDFESSEDGSHPWGTLAVDFSALFADALVYLDIHAGT